MAVRTPGAGLPARPRLLGPALAVVAVVLLFGGLLLSLYTDLLWFRSTGYSEVFSTVLLTRVLLFLLFGLLMALLVGINAAIAYRVRPPFRPMSLEQQNLERYRVSLEPYRRTVLLAGAGVVGLFAGLSAASRWQTWLLWRNGSQFGVQDAQFGRDVSYFAFTYPFQRFVLGFLLTAVILSLLAAAVVHYLFGGVRLQTVGEKVSPAARAHLSALVGLIVLLKAFAYYLDRFGLAFSDRGYVQGPHFTDVNAVLPAKTILIGIAVICALLFFANIVVRNIMLPAGALALLVVISIAIGGIYPAYTQQFRVKPNEISREEPFIERNIEATRAAYGIDDENLEIVSYAAQQDADPEQLEQQAALVDSARLLDPNEVAPTFEQLQRLTFYFGVADTLDIDRYEIDDELRDVVVAAREVDINNLSGAQRSWINERLAYTHGNGLIAAPANEVNEEGRPLFIEPDDPDSPIELDQPRIYYGELSPEYSIVNTDQPEIDGPSDFGLSGGEGEVVGEEDVDEQATFSYDGDGGVQLSHFGRKLAYALKYREPNLVLSNAIREDSRLMYVREPRERVQKVAPFLELDTDPYPAAVDGRIVWIVDGYTTSAGYPYSQRVNFGEATADSQSGGIPVPRQVNYIRNSVKATVDAYTGEVRLYQFGDRDPVLESWNKAFGGDLIRPEREIDDVPGLREHLRYPEDLFKVQRELLAQYHVTDASEFFLREDFWEIPADPAAAINRIAGGVAATTNTGPAANSPQQAVIDAAASGPSQPPFYSVLAFPDQEEPGFRLSSSFTALNRPNLAAFASVSSDPEDYGTIRVLQVPRGNPPNGPGQVANQFLSEQVVADALFPFRQNRAEVTFGNLLTLPAGGGLLYVQPVFVRAQGGESFPTLQRVLVSFGNEVAAGTTLSESLADLFGVQLPAEPVQPPGSDADPDTDPIAPGDPAPPAPAPDASPPAPPVDLDAAIQAATQAFADGQAALARQDFAAYGEAQQRLQVALQQLQALEAANETPAS